jgi:hemerythrin-like domain-containing protein
VSDFCVRHLLREHREVEKALEQLESLLAEQKARAHWSASEREDFRWVIERINRHLHHHIRKEDDVLFPALEDFLPRDLGPLAVLRGEHEDLQEVFRRILLAGALRTTNETPRAAIERLREYSDAMVRIVRDHIYKEDRVLFPMVARFLSVERDTHLLAQMEEIDRTPVPEPQTDQAHARERPVRKEIAHGV